MRIAYKHKQQVVKRFGYGKNERAILIGVDKKGAYAVEINFVNFLKTLLEKNNNREEITPEEERKMIKKN
ncbi:MAG: hypothetical protein AABZ57_02415, partial [Candidatus Margulisiibacteriota bacterium]